MVGISIGEALEQVRFNLLSLCLSASLAVKASQMKPGPQVKATLLFQTLQSVQST